MRSAATAPAVRYEDLGPDYYERQAGVRRQLHHHVTKIEALGFDITICRSPEPGPDEPANTEAA